MQEPFGDRYGLDEARDLGEYAQALTHLVEQGRRERWVAVLSEAEAYSAAELLGQFAQLNPSGAVNQLAATPASRLYHRLGA